ncbi:MAG: hypothetical protein WDN69_02105 [Aliidongia sp.]
MASAAPDGIVLPKCDGAETLRRLDHYLDALEAAAGLAHGRISIIAVVTETAKSLFTLDSYARCYAAPGRHDLGRRGSVRRARR